MINVNKLDVIAIAISICVFGLSWHQAKETSRVNSVLVHPHIDMVVIGGYGTTEKKV